MSFPPIVKNANYKLQFLVFSMGTINVAANEYNIHH